jgi:hypothetical protein
MDYPKMPRAFGFIVTTVLLLLTDSSPSVWARQNDLSGESLDSTRATLAKWMETQQIISEEKRDWQVGKELLQQRIDLIQSEITELEGKIAASRESLGEAGQKRQEVIAENRSLKAAGERLVESIDVLETKTRILLKRLPEPISQRVAPLSQRIPADPVKTQLSMGERFQNVIGVLNEVNKFNRDITVTSEIRALPDGTTAEVKALYIGLGQAYYVSNQGDSAGVGLPGEEGWQWIEASDLADEITRAIAILQNQSVPAYVPLRVSIR